MPNYGLDPTARSHSPWSLPAAVLAPGKVITDPVHGDIHLTRLEIAIVDSRPFQRLRRVLQLGNTHLVYPGAVHTRFSHSLGALRMAQVLLDVIWNQSGELHGVREDLFAEWCKENGNEPDLERWGEAITLARLGALLHDLCHVPAGHTVEDDLKALEAHDANEVRFTALWTMLRRDVLRRLGQFKGVAKSDCDAVDVNLLDPGARLHEQLKPLIVSKGDGVLPIAKMDYPFCADLVGNTICADLLDYLGRDHLFTGLPESLGRRFISAFFVTPSERGPFGERLALNILRDGHERSDVVSELLKALRYRYELSERVLVHHAKLSADAMLGESIERWEWMLWWAEARKRGLVTEIESRAQFKITRIPEYRAELERDAGRSRKSERKWRRDPLGRVDVVVRRKMEKVFQQFGDEGLVDYLAQLDPPESDPDLRSHAWAAARLAEGLRDRRLYAIAARIGAGDVSPKEIHRRYGPPAARAELEAEAQHFAGLTGEPKVILWIPEPEMRLKLAEVLVQQETGIAPFVTYERSRSRRGSDIYDAHERLWAAYVFVHRDVAEEKRRVIAAFLGSRMGIRWERHRDVIGGRPDQWPLRLAVAEELGASFESGVDRKLDEHGEKLTALAARMPDTFRALRQKVKNSAKQ